MVGGAPRRILCGGIYLIYATLFRQMGDAMDILRPTPNSEAFASCRVKFYRDGDSLRPYELTCFDRSVFKTSASFEPLCDSEFSETHKGESPLDWSDKSAARARRICRDILVNNADCGLFVTLTLDSDKINRYDYDVIIKRLSVWLDNNVRRKGLKYLLIPEYHKDGAVHFHGFFNDVLPKFDSGKKRKGKCVYNIAYPFGFSTAIDISGDDCNMKIANYCLKYMTKDHRKIGGRYYLSGGALRRPEERFFHFDISEIPGDSYEVIPGIAAKTCRDEFTISELLTRYEVF